MTFDKSLLQLGEDKHLRTDRRKSNWAWKGGRKQKTATFKRLDTYIDLTSMGK